MTNLDFNKFHDECDHWIRTGQFARAQNALKNMRGSDVPASSLKDLCNLFRRAHLWKMSLTALKPRVRPSVHPRQPKASAGEKIEYALALQRAGALRESSRLLAEPDVLSDPQSLLAQAFNSIFQWNYLEASILLERYLGSDGVQPYQHLTARVNQLACLAFLQNPQTISHFEALKKDLRGAEHRLLLGTVLEIGAQYLIVNRCWTDAETTLSEAERLLNSEGDIHMMFVHKWRAIAKALKTRSTAPLEDFSPHARTARHWETLRDLDYFRFVIEPDSPWAGWVYYGTPYRSFRERMETLRKFPEQGVVSQSTRPTQVVDPWFVGDQHGELTHLLFNFLLRDFYRPAKIGEIFSELFYQGYLDPESSHNRIHQLVRRLRTWLVSNRLPFQIVEVEGAYGLHIIDGIGLVCRKRILAPEKLPFIFGRFYTVSGGAMTAREWGERLGITTTKSRNLLSQAIPLGLVRKLGDGPATRYELTDSYGTPAL